MPAKAAFILVHYHAAELLRRAIDAIFADVHAARIEAELLVVDNGSDPAEERLLRTLPAQYIANPANTGYAAGLNLGIANTTSEFLFLMNPDVFLVPGCTERLLAALSAGAAACGPLFFWDEQRTFLLPPTEERTPMAELASAVAERSTMAGRYARRRWRRHAHHHWLAESAVPSRSLSGALIATRRSVLHRVGLFDESFQLYFEEQDWLTRLGLAGLRSVFVPGAEAIHLFNQSAVSEPRAVQWARAAEARYAAKHYPRWLPRALDVLHPSDPDAAYRLRAMPDSPPRLDLEPIGARGAASAWIEVSPFAKGIPAAAARIDPPGNRVWTFPASVWQHIGAGRYSLTVCSGTGRELFRGTFERPPL